jgi:acyl-CoA synthetase (AMP-forming)/AMP-acid ligase II
MKDVIIRIGDKIFPSEIEEFFMEHPDILEAQVKSVSVFEFMYAYCHQLLNVMSLMLLVN